MMEHLVVRVHVAFEVLSNNESQESRVRIHKYSLELVFARIALLVFERHIPERWWLIPECAEFQTQGDGSSPWRGWRPG